MATGDLAAEDLAVTDSAGGEGGRGRGAGDEEEFPSGDSEGLRDPKPIHTRSFGLCVNLLVTGLKYKVFFSGCDGYCDGCCGGSCGGS